MLRRRPRTQHDQLIVLRGELISFSRRSPDGWGIGRLKPSGAAAPQPPPDDFGLFEDGADGSIAIVGKVLDARAGDTIELQGRYQTHPVHGPQFRIEHCVAERAESIDGVTAWLESTLPRIGPKRAREMIERFGSVAELWRVIEHEHHRLAELDGITSDAAEIIHAAYSASRATRDHMITLRGWGLSNNQIQHCLDTWHTLDEVVTQVRCNPYLLARYVQGFGFLRADEVAKLAGMPHNAPERIEAGIVHVLHEATASGHVWMWGGALQRVAADDLLKVSYDEVYEGIVRAIRNGLIVRRGKRIYSARMEAAEAACALGVSRLLDTTTPATSTSTSHTLH